MMPIEQLSIAKAQQKSKPSIEEIINEYLSGENQKNAHDFVAIYNNLGGPIWAI